MNRSRNSTATVFAGLGFILLLTNTAAAAESIHPDSVTPAARFSDAPNWELGTIFRTSLAGTITQVRAFSLVEESGDHQVRVWRNADSALIAGPITWTFGGEEAWIVLDIPAVPILANQDYTLSISTTADGWYAANSGYFGSAGNNGENLSFPQGAGVFSDTLGTQPTNSFNNTSYLRDIVFEPDLSGTVMRIRWNEADIADGATNSFIANGTDLGGRALDGSAREYTYTINNLGQTALELTGNPRVAIAGAQAGDFTVTTQPAASVPGGGSTSFTIRFDPSAIAIRRAAVSIPHADSPTDPYDFSVQGTGLGGGAGVLGNDSDGSFARNIDDTQIHGNRFAAPVAMRITGLHARVFELAGTFKCAVYSDANGFADRLLRSSLDVLNATNGWNSFALTEPLDLVAGDYYWLVIWSDTLGARIQADPVGAAYQGAYSYIDLGGEWPDPIGLPNLIQSEPRTYCIYAEGTPIGIAPGAELDLKGGGKLIVSGDPSPSVLDGTDFGNVNVGSDGPNRTFTIENRGDAALELSANPVISVTGPQAGDFLVSAPPASPIAPAGTGTFAVRFHPTARGFRTATVSIANNDADENPYQFVVQGAGLTTGRESIWADTMTGGDINFDGTYYELGTIFRSSVPGKITHLRVYSLASEAGDHTARLWRNDSEEVIGGPYTWTYGGTTGWISFDIPDVDIVADTEYTVSISTGTSAQRNYPNIAGGLAAEGGNGQHLFYPIDAGVFTETRDGRPVSSFNHGNYLRDVIFVPEGTIVELPDIDVKGNGISIARGDGSPSAADGTDFGQVAAAGGTVEHTFAITNTGTATLNLGSTPKVAITGTQAGSFVVVTQPAASVPVGGTSSFTVRFAPPVAGTHSATVSIDNDSDQNPYDFAIVGLGTGVAAPFRIVEIRPDLATGNALLRWEGEGPQFQVEKAAALTGSFQPLGAVLSERVFTDAGALNAATQAFYRVRQVAGTEPLCSTASAGAGWINTPMAEQTGTFTAQFDATPLVAPLDSVMALSSGPGAQYPDFACLTRFNTEGNIDARNAGAYAADNAIPYSANVKYSFRLVVNVPAHTYSVYVSSPGSPEQTVGADFAFRSEQGEVTSLNNWAVIVDALSSGTNTVCEFRIP